MPNKPNVTTALITDSTCDIPPSLLETYQIRVLPAYVIWGDEQYRDRIDLQPQAFYRRMVDDPVYPKSAHPTPGDFVDALQAAREDGAQEAVVITVSSAMSGTYGAARQAAQRVNMPVYVVDSKGPTMSLGWQVLAAARAREAGGDAQAMIEAAAAVRERLALLVYMDAVKYLEKGGRIGNAVSLVGTVLRIRPVVRIDHTTGVVEVEKVARTRRRGIEAMVQGFYSRLDRTRPVHVAVLHGDAPDDAEALAERIRAELDPTELLINTTGPVLGINTGPRALALSGYSEPS
jgi:DegV family protein with EDD domain